MKKSLRMWCMGAVAAFSTLSFAQTDVTEKLLNPDAEKGMLGWDVTFVDGGQVWNKQTKGEEASPGYHGFNNWAFENWRNANGALTNSSVFQLVQDLPNGTYVFGAYAMATNDSWEPSIDLIDGVYLFANEQEIRVATHRVEGVDEKWAHSIKFNVATTVTDGTLKVGMKTQDCNTNFVAMDNATLWFFGDMSHEAALEEMAKIDIAASVEKITPFLEAGKVNADTLAYLQAAIEAAQGEVTTANAVQLDEELYWGKRLVKRSLVDYAALAEAIAAAKEVAAGDWSTAEETVDALEALNELIAVAEAGYEEGSVTRPEVNAYKDALAEASAAVSLDVIYTLLDVYNELIDSIKGLQGEEIGEYSPEMIEAAEAFNEMVYEELDLLGEVSAVEIKANCETLFAKIQEIVDNPLDYASFPIVIGRGTELLPGQTDPYLVLEGAYVKNYPAGVSTTGATFNDQNNVITYDSKLYRFREPLTKVRFVVKENGNNDFGVRGEHPVFCLGRFEMYDENGVEIPLSTENVRTNACHNTLNTHKDGGGLPALFDKNPWTYFHSSWDAVVPDYHYLEVTLPEGEYDAFSFSMASYSSRHSRNFPAVLEITYVSDAIAGLQDAVTNAQVFISSLLIGNAPGFYNVDFSAINEAIAEGKALLDKAGVSDNELKTASNKIIEERAKIENQGIMMPSADKKYRIVNADSRFFANQNVQKAMTIFPGEYDQQRLWWQDANPDSLQQEFSFEFIEEIDGEPYYAIKNVKTDLYVGEYFNSETNERVDQFFALSERKDPFLLRSAGYGQFFILRKNHEKEYLHANYHNNGVPADDLGVEITPGSVPGVTGPITTWQTAVNNLSSWFILEMTKLPQATKSITELNFRSGIMALYEGVDMVVLTADKECAFEDLKVVNLFGQEIKSEITVAGNKATIDFGSVAVANFSFLFTNTEGVAEVTVSGSYKQDSSTAYTALQNAYNTVSALAPVEGTGVGQVVSLIEYNDALAVAEDLLENGGDDAALEAATVALKAAADGLVYNLPKADVDYFILLGIDAIRTNHLTDMAVFADDNTDALRWTYVSLTNPAYRWKFIDCGELKHGRNAYYIQGVESGCYVARTIDSNAAVFLVEDTTETRPYDIHFLNNGKVAINDTYWSNGEASLHPNGHGGGAAGYKGRNMITWGKQDAASAMRIVEAEAYIGEALLAIGIEDIEVGDEYVAPSVKGTYDLFGRRIETPAATGIYIVDGKKVLIKREQK